MEYSTGSRTPETRPASMRRSDSGLFSAERQNIRRAARRRTALSEATLKPVPSAATRPIAVARIDVTARVDGPDRYPVARRQQGRREQNQDHSTHAIPRHIEL
jgi:hypothetical protein